MYFGPAKSEAVKNLREEECFVGCGRCRFFDVKADLPGVTSSCRRLDHKTLRFRLSPFKSYDCGQSAAFICREFAPHNTWMWLHSHWLGTDEYVGEVPAEARLYLNIQGDRSIGYAVSYAEFYDGTFIQDGFLRCYGKQYHKRNKSSPTGYGLVTEVYDDPVLIPLHEGMEAES